MKQWGKLFFLSGGYYNLFEVLKEGGRSYQRSRFSSTKVGGSMGEVLRDKWYLNVFHKSILTKNNLSEILVRKLLNAKEPKAYCTNNFKSLYIDKYRNLLKSEADEYVTSNNELDLTQKFMFFMFSHYTQGWNGCLYNFHNNVISLIAPFMNNQFFLNCLWVDANFRKNASGITKSINKFYPKFKKITFIDRQKCSELKGLNLLRYVFYKKIVTKIRTKYFCYNQVKDYNHAFWLKTLLSDSEFKTKIEKSSREFHYIISNSQFNNLIKEGLNNQLNRDQYDFLWKLISLKLTQNYE